MSELEVREEDLVKFNWGSTDELKPGCFLQGELWTNGTKIFGKLSNEPIDEWDEITFDVIFVHADNGDDFSYGAMFDQPYFYTNTNFRFSTIKPKQVKALQEAWRHKDEVNKDTLVWCTGGPDYTVSVWHRNKK